LWGDRIIYFSISHVSNDFTLSVTLIFHKQQRNKEQEKEVLEWIFAVLGEPVPAGDYETILKDGIVLCKLANKLTPGCIKKIQERGTAFQLMENVQRLKINIDGFKNSVKI
jgi:Calponin homology (CH) domain